MNKPNAVDSLPIPVVVPPVVVPPPPTASVHGLAGLHGRADGRMQEPDFTTLMLAKMQAVKLTSDAAPEDVDRLKQLNPDLLIVIRLIASFKGRHVSADDFAHWVQPNITAFYARGVRYFELHNEPNLVDEGWGLSWSDGAGFAAWFEAVATQLRRWFPDIKLGWPGLSPGGDFLHVRTDALAFLDSAQKTSADWIGVHVYWNSRTEMMAAVQQISEYRKRFRGRPFMVTEFADLGADKGPKGAAYNEFYGLMATIPDLLASFCFVVSSSSGFTNQTWRNEDGSLTVIPAIVGSRGQPAIVPAPKPAGVQPTHTITATLLNVRMFPWSGTVQPPVALLMPLKHDDMVTVYGVYKSEAMSFGWGCISPNGNEWISLKYAVAL